MFSTKFANDPFEIEKFECIIVAEINSLKPKL